MEQSPKKAVVLGASGFIGINLVNALDRAGIRTLCFSRRPSVGWPSGIYYLQGNISDPPKNLLKAMEGALVFHLVSSSTPRNTTDGVESEINQVLLPTLNLLERSKHIGCRWIFASSGGTVYGHSGFDRISEEHPNNPISSYGICKLSLEKYFGLYNQIHEKDCVIARIANPYGPWQDGANGQGIVGALLRRIAAREQVEIWGDGENVRDYIYVEDVADALVTLALKAKAGRIYNVGSGTGTSVNSLIEKISTYLELTPNIVYKQSRSVDVRRNVLDTSRIRDETGWRPCVELDEGIALAHAWLQRPAEEGVSERPPI